MAKCLSCGKKTLEAVKFQCPKCDYEIVRCNKCRNLSIKYICPICGHIGP